ncbi:MAG TPA: hypothetical protein VGB68_02820 [Pyrinomonadaceae bacterium]|jgi:hypothetical protein
MLNISNYLRNKLLDKAVSGTNFTPGANLFIRLFTTPLDRDAVGTELDNLGYTPLQVANNLTTFPAASSGAKANAVRFDFEPAEEDWNPILSIGIFDASTAGNLYFYQNLDDALQIDDEQNLYFDIGDIQFEIL